MKDRFSRVFDETEYCVKDHLEDLFIYDNGIVVTMNELATECSRLEIENEELKKELGISEAETKRFSITICEKHYCKNCKHLQHDGFCGIWCGVHGNNRNYDCSKYEKSR